MSRQIARNGSWVEFLSLQEQHNKHKITLTLLSCHIKTKNQHNDIKLHILHYALHTYIGGGASWTRLDPKNSSKEISINHFSPISTYIPGRVHTGFSLKNKFRSVCINIIIWLILKVCRPQNDITY